MAPGAKVICHVTAVTGHVVYASWPLTKVHSGLVVRGPVHWSMA